MSSSLILASMKNNIIDPDEMARLSRIMKGDYTISTGDSTKNAQARTILNTVLSATAKKRACCLGQKNIDVRIPLPLDIAPEGEIGKLMSIYGFYDRQVTNIPIDQPGYCTIEGKDYVPEKDNCDTFYNIYCKNIAKEFTAGNNGQFDSIKFNNYKPECACFIDPPDWFKEQIVTPVPKCFYPGCEKTANVYLDPTSRTGACDFTICSQQLNIDSALLQKDASFTAQFQNQCGKESKNDPLKKVDTVTSTGTGTQTTAAPIGASSTGGTGAPATTTVTTPPVEGVKTTQTTTTGDVLGGIFGSGTTAPTTQQTSAPTTKTPTTQSVAKPSTGETTSNMPLIVGGSGLVTLILSVLCCIFIIIGVLMMR